MEDVDLQKFKDQIFEVGYAHYSWYWYPRWYCMWFQRENGNYLTCNSPLGTKFMTLVNQWLNFKYPSSHMEGSKIVREVEWFPSVSFRNWMGVYLWKMSICCLLRFLLSLWLT